MSCAEGDTGYIWLVGGYMLAASTLVILTSVAVSYVSSRVATGSTVTLTVASGPLDVTINPSDYIGKPVAQE